MKFSDVLKEIENGKKARRKSWSVGEEYIFEVTDLRISGDEVNPFLLIKTDENPSLSIFQPNTCEILADDWEIVE
ncbi:DUF2829 domain-containing protein [Lactobacillus terrae]|uniref:DUF2829 domain-containing protein n=1 Tax=Lactobacillus terrae TaxID=2269374 RepID=UPI000C1B7D02|nr:DUF2829 domain-containing protein [Lactobacillus terrae]